MKTSFFHRIGQNAKSVGNCSHLFRFQKPSVSAERCRKNQPCDFHSGFVGTFGRQNMCYSFVAAHDSKKEGGFSKIFSCFRTIPELDAFGPRGVAKIGPGRFALVF